MKKCSANCKSESGFSLTELLTVLAGVTILASIGIPMLSQSLDQYNLVLAAQGIGSQLQFARMKAITSNESLRVNFPDSTNYYQVEFGDGTVVKGPFYYPRSVRANNVDSDTPVTFPGRYITFQPNGSIPSSGNGSSGRIKLINRAGVRVDIVVTGGGVVRQTSPYREPPAPF
jgi:Tfp pilus assembly protein FimT